MVESWLPQRERKSAVWNPVLDSGVRARFKRESRERLAPCVEAAFEGGGGGGEAVVKMRKWLGQVFKRFSPGFRLFIFRRQNCSS